MRVPAVTQSIASSLFTFRSKHMFLGLLWYTGSSRKSEGIRTRDVGGQNPFQVISLREIRSKLKMLFRLNDTYSHPAQSNTEVPIRNRSAQIKG